MIGQPGINGDVQARMDAYRGNPQALAQQYSQNQQLVDLLALQKLKSEKEAAARQMQMQMDAAGLPTIAQQREQEVMDLTKKEVAQQAGVGGQQQENQQKEAMQKLLQAAGAPQEPQQAVPQPTQQPPPTGAAGISGLPAPNMMPPQAMAAGGIIAFQEGGDTGPPLTAEELMRLREEQAATSVQLPSGARNLAESGARRLMERDPQAMFELRRQQAQEAYGLTPQERESRESRIRETQQYDESRFGPQAQRSEALSRFLLGAGRSSTLGGALTSGGAAVTDYSAQMREQDRARMLQRQGRQQEIEDIGRGARGKGMDVGMEAEKTGLGALQAGTKSAADIYGSDATVAAAGIRAAGQGGEKVTPAVLDERFIENRAQQLKLQNPGMSDLDAVVEAQAELMQRKGQAQYDPGLANAVTNMVKEDRVIKNLSLDMLKTTDPGVRAEIQSRISERTREIENMVRSTAQGAPPTGRSSPPAGSSPPPPPPGFVVQ